MVTNLLQLCFKFFRFAQKVFVFFAPLSALLKEVTMQFYDFVVLVWRWYWELFNLYGKNKQNCLLLVSMLLGKEKNKIIYCLFVWK